MEVIKVTKENFEQEVLQSDKPVVADFNASWCGPCKMLGPVIAELAAEREDIKFVSIDIDDEDELADEYDVSSVPCIVVFEDGAEADRAVGFRQKDQIVDMIGG